MVNKDIGTVVKPISVEDNDIHKHELKRMKQRDVSEDDAKSYRDNARVLFKKKF